MGIIKTIQTIQYKLWGSNQNNGKMEKTYQKICVGIMKRQHHLVIQEREF